MKTKLSEDPKPELPKEADGVKTAEVGPVNDINALFKRPINSLQQPRSLTLKRVLTRPLVSMAHTKKLAVIAQSEMYLFDLPLTGRKGGSGQVRVFDAKDAMSDDEIIVICSAVMVSALQKAGFKTIGFLQDAELNITYPEQPGRSLKDAAFAFLGGDIADGKRYRSISVAELEVGAAQ